MKLKFWIELAIRSREGEDGARSEWEENKNQKPKHSAAQQKESQKARREKDEKVTNIFQFDNPNSCD